MLVSCSCRTLSLCSSAVWRRSAGCPTAVRILVDGIDTPAMRARNTAERSLTACLSAVKLGSYRSGPRALVLAPVILGSCCPPASHYTTTAGEPTAWADDPVISPPPVPTPMSSMWARMWLRSML